MVGRISVGLDNDRIALNVETRIFDFAVNKILKGHLQVEIKKDDFNNLQLASNRKLRLNSKPGGLDVETNQDRDRERP